MPSRPRAWQISPSTSTKYPSETNAKPDHESSVGPCVMLARAEWKARALAKGHMKSMSWQDQISRHHDFAASASRYGSATHVGPDLPVFAAE